MWTSSPPSPSTSILEHILRWSPFCRLILETEERQRLDAIPDPIITRQLVDQPVCSQQERAGILADFQRRLESIALYCETIGTLPMFIVPASDDGDFEPSRSVLPPTAPPEVRAAFAREFRRALKLEATDPEGARAAYSALIRIAPGFAESHYRLARLLGQAGEWDEAREHYIQARERDAMPLRCPEAFRQAYRDVAAQHPSVVLVDSARVLEPLSPHGILDNHMYHDAQHPTLLGYIALAQDLLKQLRERQAFGSVTTPVPTIDPTECARHFGLEREQWVRVCERSAWFWRVTSYIRYDPRSRKEREEAYMRAARTGQVGSVSRARRDHRPGHPPSTGTVMLAVLEVAYPLLAIGLLVLTGLALACLFARPPSVRIACGVILARLRAGGRDDPDRTGSGRVHSRRLPLPGSIGCPIWRWSRPLRRQASANDDVTLVVVGESSAEGVPYRDWLSVGKIVVWQLRRLFPQRMFHVEVQARPGWTLEQMQQKLAESRRRPDVVIIYAGHNEFASRFGWSSERGLLPG